MLIFTHSHLSFTWCACTAVFTLTVAVCNLMNENLINTYLSDFHVKHWLASNNIMIAKNLKNNI